MGGAHVSQTGELVSLELKDVGLNGRRNKKAGMVLSLEFLSTTSICSSLILRQNSFPTLPLLFLLRQEVSDLKTKHAAEMSRERNLVQQSISSIAALGKDCDVSVLGSMTTNVAGVAAHKVTIQGKNDASWEQKIIVQYCAFDWWNPQSENVYRVVDLWRAWWKRGTSYNSSNVRWFRKDWLWHEGVRKAGYQTWFATICYIWGVGVIKDSIDLLYPLPSFTCISSRILVPGFPLLPILGALQNTSEELQELFRTREAANSCWALKSGLPYQFECGINSWFKKGTWYLWAYFVLELFCKGWEVHKNKLSFAESYEAAALTVRGKLLDPLFSAVVLKAFLAGSSCCVWDFVMLVTSRD